MSRHFQSSLYWDSEDDEAHRLLGHANSSVSSGDLIEAALLTQRLHKRNPTERSLHWELGFVYQRMAATVDAIVGISELYAYDQQGTLSQVLGAPQCILGTNNCTAGVAMLAVIHPDEAGAIFVPESRVHTSLIPLCTELRLPLYAKPQNNALSVFFGQLGTDNGQNFEELRLHVLVEKGQRETGLEVLDLDRNDWTGTTISLSHWSDGDANLVLRVTAAGIGVEGSDLSGSSIIVDDLPSLAELWQDLEWDTEVLVRLGDEEWRNENTLAALWWYRQAAVLEPEAAYIWERIGRVYESQGQWKRALSNYRRVVTSSDQTGITSLAGIYTKMASIERWHLDESDFYTHKAYLYAALRVDDFSTVREEAEVHYKLAVVLEKEGFFEKAIWELQQAIRTDPAFIWAHVRLGWLLYREHRDVRGAQRELTTALDLGASDRQAYWAYRHLGVIEWQEGSQERAELMFNKALSADPNVGQTLSQLKREALGISGK